MEISKAFLLEEKNKKKPSAETLQTVLIWKLHKYFNPGFP